MVEIPIHAADMYIVVERFASKEKVTVKMNAMNRWKPTYMVVTMRNIKMKRKTLPLPGRGSVWRLGPSSMFRLTGSTHICHTYFEKSFLFIRSRTKARAPNIQLCAIDTARNASGSEALETKAAMVPVITRENLVDLKALPREREIMTDRNK